MAVVVAVPSGLVTDASLMASVPAA